MILVTGGTGTIGSEVVRQLAEAGQRVRVLARRPERGAVQGPNVQSFAADLLRPETLPAAMEGVDRMFLLAVGPELARMEANAIDAAARAGVKHVVKLSVLGASEDSAIPFARWHREGERRLEASGMAWTFLRPSSFMNNDLFWAQTIKCRGAVLNPTGGGRTCMIDPADIAAVAVKTLTEPGHEGRTYQLTGPENLNAPERVARLSETLDRNLRVVDVSLEEVKQAMVESGVPPESADELAAYFCAMPEGEAEGTTPDVQQVLGRKPRDYGTWACVHAAAFVG